MELTPSYSNNVGVFNALKRNAQIFNTLKQVLKILIPLTFRPTPTVYPIDAFLEDLSGLVVVLFFQI